MREGVGEGTGKVRRGQGGAMRSEPGRIKER